MKHSLLPPPYYTTPTCSHSNAWFAEELWTRNKVFEGITYYCIWGYNTDTSAICTGYLCLQLTQLQLQCDVNSDQIELGLSLEGRRSHSTTQPYVLEAIILRLSNILCLWCSSSYFGTTGMHLGPTQQHLIKVHLLITYVLPPWTRVLLEKLICSHLVKKFLAFYGTRRFITAFTSARHLSLSWASSIQSIPPHPTSWGSNLILSRGVAFWR